ncbi:hypothetical protein D3C71_996310 [compost metagenome]
MISTALSYNIDVQSSTYLGIMYEVSSLKPMFENLILDELRVRKIVGNIFSVFLNYQRNTFNNLFYPTKGSNLFFENRFALFTYEDLDGEISVEDSTSSTGISTQRVRVAYKFNPSYRVALTFDKYFKVHRKISLPISFKTGFVINNLYQILGTNKYPVQENSTSFAEYFNIGGINTTSRNGSVDLWGYRNGEVSSKAFYSLRVGVQWECLRKLFVTPYINVLYSADEVIDFGNNIKHAFDYSKKDPSKTYDYTNSIAYGINIRFKTILGPINLNVSKVSSFSKPTAFLSIGYYF